MPSTIRNVPARAGLPRLHGLAADEIEVWDVHLLAAHQGQELRVEQR